MAWGQPKENNDRFIVVHSQGKLGSPFVRIFADRETGVQYVNTWYGTDTSGLTVLLGSDGKPLLYKPPVET